MSYGKEICVCGKVLFQCRCARPHRDTVSTAPCQCNKAMAHIPSIEEVLRIRAEKAESQVAALREALDEAEKALVRIANPSCGCRPVCQCLEPGSLAIYREHSMEIAFESLARLRSVREG